VARFDTEQLPWSSDVRSRPDHRLYYRVILGSMLMEPVTEALVEVFGDDETRSSSANGKGRAVVAELMLN